MDAKNKIGEFFGAETYEHPIWGESLDWSKRNELANKLTKGTCYTGITGGVAASVIGGVTETTGLMIGGGVAAGVGILMMIPTLVSHVKDDNTIASFLMKGLVSLGTGAKNVVAWPIKAIKDKIQEHKDDYDIHFSGPYHD